MDWKQLYRDMLDVIYPPICILCRDVSTGCYPHLCGNCLRGFEPVGACCTRCGEPFPGEKRSHLCLSCMLSKPPFLRAGSVFLYRGQAAKAVALFKYGRGNVLDQVMADIMAHGAEGLMDPLPDLVVPVPEARRFMGRRSLDITWFLAEAAAGRLGVPVARSALQRQGRKRQVGLSRSARELSARASYRQGQQIREVGGRRVLLVDDVYTTGATVRACSRLLNRGGASVSVLTLARRSAENLEHLLVDDAV